MFASDSLFIQHFAGKDLSLQWYHPVTIILTGILCALPTILLRGSDQWNRKTFWRRVPLHCLALYAVVVGAGWLFRWYDDTESLIGVSVIFSSSMSLSGCQATGWTSRTKKDQPGAGSHPRYGITIIILGVAD